MPEENRTSTISKDEAKIAAENLREWYYNDLGWCGCGAPVQVMDLMMKVLRAISEHYPLSEPSPLSPEGIAQSWEKFKNDMAILGGIESPIYMTYMYVLDVANLTEHGSGLSSGGWLTDKGREVLSWMEAVEASGIDWNDE